MRLNIILNIFSTLILYSSTLFPIIKTSCMTSLTLTIYQVISFLALTTLTIPSTKFTTNLLLRNTTYFFLIPCITYPTFFVIRTFLTIPCLKRWTSCTNSRINFEESMVTNTFISIIKVFNTTWLNKIFKTCLPFQIFRDRLILSCFFF